MGLIGAGSSLANQLQINPAKNVAGAVVIGNNGRDRQGSVGIPPNLKQHLPDSQSPDPSKILSNQADGSNVVV
jgi:hypothetical protein